jgi:hypothetical protein
MEVYAQAVLLPFEHHIIHNSLIISHNVVLGPGIRRDLREQFRTLQEREGIITSLLPEDLILSAREQRDEISACNRKVELTRFWDSASGIVQDELIRTLLVFAVRFRGR